MGIRTNILINNMSAGELSPEMLGRVDLAKYQNGCETLVNWLPLIEGGMMSRPGTRFVSAAKYGDRQARLLPFVFSTLQAYMLEFGHGYIRFYKDGGQIVDDDDAPIQISSPYTETDLPRVKYQQRADVLYLVHPGYPRKKLSRTSHTAWTLTDVDDTEGAFLDENSDGDWIITASGGELVTNGVFTTDTTGWSDESVGTGSFAASAGAGVLTHGGGTDIGAAQTSFPTTIGLVYTVTFNVGVGSIDAQVGTGPGLADLLASATYTTGAKSMVFTATNSTAYIYFANVTASTAHTIDNVSCNKPLHTGAQVTLASNRDTWLPGHVGAFWKLSDQTGSPAEKAWTAAEALGAGNLGVRRVYNGHVYEMTSEGTTGTKPPVHLRGTASDGGNDWVYINDGWGYAEILAYNSARSVSAIVRQHLPKNAASGTSYWSEGAFSGVQGYPRAIAFIEQRTALAGASGHPARVDLSETGAFEGFRAGTLADNAIAFEIDSGSVNAILWMEKGGAWFAGTNGAIYTLTTSQDTPIAPDNLPRADEINAYGTADIQPLKIGGKLLYVQRGGKRVRELDYKADTANDVRSDRTVLARHITNDSATILQWCYQQDPNQTVWAVRSDGVLLALTYFPEQDVIAWSRHVTDGTFESVATIPTATSDQTWVIVRREINGQVKRYVEYLDPTVNTDCALTYRGTPVTSIAASSFSHLMGKEVQVVASGGKLTPFTVSTDDLSFSRAHAFVEIGLKFDSDCLTVRPEVRTNEGSTQGIKAANPVTTVRVISTPTISINGQNYPTRGNRDYMDTGPPYITGDITITTLGHTTTKQLRIQRVEPFPAKVIGLFATIDTGDL